VDPYITVAIYATAVTNTSFKRGYSNATASYMQIPTPLNAPQNQYNLQLCITGMAGVNNFQILWAVCTCSAIKADTRYVFVTPDSIAALLVSPPTHYSATVFVSCEQNQQTY
jgi:hypothetical protein